MAQLTQMQSGLLEELAQAALIYQTSHTREEIALLSDLFAEALEDEADWPAIAKAFALHRKRCKRFPTPAHILELLPECHIAPKRIAIEESTQTTTPGFGKKMCEQWLQKHKGVEVAEALGNILQQASQGC